MRSVIPKISEQITTFKKSEMPKLFRMIKAAKYTQVINKNMNKFLSMGDLCIHPQRGIVSLF
ncbi:hypothetical protein M5F00_15510 [Acinetobacter sp. ANC 4945]|uniref:hypothetical protein n=1 Tax=Acinetobacter amyesii TaxID=2942470 RepID=UPI0011783918|nr:hypothetical protein [Acinetobacter amyesii]MCL6249259.1 hypothetical protein [Acinetobacter amyesii]